MGSIHFLFFYICFFWFASFVETGKELAVNHALALNVLVFSAIRIGLMLRYRQ